MDDEHTALVARIAAVEILICHMMAEASLALPDGTAAGLIRDAVGKQGATIIPPMEVPRSIIGAHLDSLLRTAEAMRRRIRSSG